MKLPHSPLASEANLTRQNKKFYARNVLFIVALLYWVEQSKHTWSFIMKLLCQFVQNSWFYCRDYLVFFGEVPVESLILLVSFPMQSWFFLAWLLKSCLEPVKSMFLLTWLLKSWWCFFGSISVTSRGFSWRDYLNVVGVICSLWRICCLEPEVGVVCSLWSLCCLEPVKSVFLLAWLLKSCWFIGSVPETSRGFSWQDYLNVVGVFWNLCSRWFYWGDFVNFRSSHWFHCEIFFTDLLTLLN